MFIEKCIFLIFDDLLKAAYSLHRFWNTIKPNVYGKKFNFCSLKNASLVFDDLSKAACSRLHRFWNTNKPNVYGRNINVFLSKKMHHWCVPCLHFESCLNHNYDKPNVCEQKFNFCSFNEKRMIHVVAASNDRFWNTMNRKFMHLS